MSCPAPTCMTDFPPIDPDGEEVLSFNFSNGLPDGVSLGAPYLELSSSPVDAGIASRFSSPQVHGNSVRIAVANCVEGTLYHIRVIAPTSDPLRTLVIGADLLCKLF